MSEHLEGIEAVRRRPAMYFGSRDARTIELMTMELVSNVIDLHLAHAARSLRVDVHADGSVEVEDDGPGMSSHDVGGRTAIEHVFTTLHRSATFDGHCPHVHAGTRGVGVCAVNALSARLEVESRHGGRAWRGAFERGRVVDAPRPVARAEVSGTRVRFWPDVETLGAARVAPENVRARLRELQWIHPTLAITCCGRPLPWRGGLAGLVRETAGRSLAPDSVVAGHRTIDDVDVDFAVGWRRHGRPDVASFVNSDRSVEGTHVTGLLRAVATVAQRVDAEAAERALGGLVAAVHVRVLHPSWAGPTKERLLTPIVLPVVKRAVIEALDHAVDHRAFGAWLRRRLGARPRREPG